MTHRWRATLVPILIVGACSLSCQSSQDGDRAVLKPKFELGRVTYLETRGEKVIESTLLGSTPEKQTERRGGMIGFLQSVESIAEDGTARVKLQFDRLALSSTQEGKTVAYDSDRDDPYGPGRPWAEIITPMLGRSVRMKIDKDLAVTSCVGMKETRRRVQQKNWDNPFCERIKDSLLTNAAMKLMMELHLAPYPNRAVAIGDSWEHTIRSHGIVQEFRFTVERFAHREGRREVVVAFTLQLRQEEEKKPYTEDGYTTTVKENQGQGRGWVTFDGATGELLECYEEAQQTMRYVMSAQGRKQTWEYQNTATCKDRARVLTEEQRSREKAAHWKQKPVTPGPDR